MNAVQQSYDKEYTVFVLPPLLQQSGERAQRKKLSPKKYACLTYDRTFSNKN